MKPWLIDFSCDADLGLLENHEYLVHTLHNGQKVAFANLEKGEGFRGFHIQMILMASDSASAQIESEQIARSLTRDLTFFTKLRIGLPIINYVIDWSPGIDVRQAYVFQHFDDPDFYRGLGEPTLNVVRQIQSSENYGSLRRCLHWYYCGVNARDVKDQFQYFWYALEVASTTNADRTKVVDKCLRCRGDLICKSCGKLSKHRPFDKDLIAKTLSELGLNESLQKELFAVRNGLAHGEEPEQIREAQIQSGNTGFDFYNSCNGLAIFTARALGSKFKMEPETPWLEKRDFTLRKMQGKLEMNSRFPYREELDEYIKVDLPKIEMTEGEGAAPKT